MHKWNQKLSLFLYIYIWYQGHNKNDCEVAFFNDMTKICRKQTAEARHDVNEPNACYDHAIDFYKTVLHLGYSHWAPDQPWCHPNKNQCVRKYIHDADNAACTTETPCHP